MDERKEISEHPEKAFSVRNKIVHNGDLGKPIEICGRNLSMSELTSKLREYLRE